MKREGKNLPSWPALPERKVFAGFVGPFSAEAFLANLRKRFSARALHWKARHRGNVMMAEGLPFRFQYPSPAAGFGVARARLDNRRELLDELELGEYASEEEFFFEGQQRWGSKNLATKLLGDFSLALASPQEELLGLRDPTGAHSFFYSHQDDGLVFGSELEVLLACPFVSQAYDEETVARFLQHHYFLHPARTFFRDIHRLPPGWLLEFSVQGLQLKRYYYPEDLEPFASTDEEELLHQLVELLERSVECRLGGASRVGVHLSGGLDSSSIAVIAARRLGGERLRGFSWSAPPETGNEPTDERRRVLEISRRERIPVEFFIRYAHEVRGHLLRDPSREPWVMSHLEEPVLERAAEQGVELLLSGWGGDEFVSSNGRGVLPGLFLRGDWRRVLKECHLSAQRREGVWWRDFRAKVLAHFLPDWLYFRIYPNQAGPSFISESLCLRQPVAEFRVREFVGLRRNFLELWRAGHLQQRIESWAQAGLRRGLIYRYPLLDKRLVEFAFRVPEEFFHRDGYTRYLFRKASEGWLGSELVWGSPKGEVTPLKTVRAPRLDPDPGSLLREITNLSAKPPHDFIDWSALLATWSGSTGRGVLRSRAIQCAFLGREPGGL